MSKRRLISLLPSIYQTADLTTFFGATVDEVFQPGTSDSLSGYIGHSLTGGTGFYVGEPSAERAFYQLEPSMISYDATAKSTIDYALTYPDMVSYLAVNGANVSDQHRLFETDYYSWAPPINIDMLVNYRDYYWFGDSNDVTTTVGYTFNVNDRNPTVILANSNLTALSSGAGPQAVRSTPLTGGSWYVEFTVEFGINSASVQYCGLANGIDAITGLPGQQTGGNAIVLASNGFVYADAGAPIATLSGYGNGDTVCMAWSSLTRTLWFRVNNGNWNIVPASPTGGGGFDISTLLAGGAVQTVWAGTANDCQVTINFGGSPFAFTVPAGYGGPSSSLPSTQLPILPLRVPVASYIGDGTRTSFALPPSILSVPSQAEVPTAYVNNVAVAATVSGNNLTLASAPANGTAVVTCRTPDLAAVIAGAATVNVSDLNSEGVTYLSSTMRIKIIDAAHLSEAWDAQPWDDTPWDASDGGIYMVDGIGQSLRLTADATIIRGLVAQYVTVERSTYDVPTKPWAQRNSWVHKDSFAWATQNFPNRQAARPIIEFIRDLQGYAGQTWSESFAPLFMLYDLDNHALDDTGYYPDSNFEGSRIFGYAVGTSTLPLAQITAAQVFDANGYTVFSNDVADQPYTFALGIANPITTPITGLIQYGIVNSADAVVAYDALWHPAVTPTAQTIRNGFYEIPRNLQANPNYEDVSLISRASWAAHFNSLIASQTTVYRDSARDLSLGTSILQHHAPMLKCMLLASNSAFDFLEAARYAELEYTRFRNKFARKLIDLRNRGTLLDTDAPTLWVSTVLAALKIGHTNDFPFALSSMAGGQYFIPSTPTALGMLPAAIPAFVVDTTYDPPITMLLGHDGSLTPTFGDYRDNVLLALETQIYQNLQTTPSEVRPAFDIQAWLGGYFNQPLNGYSWSETATILAPMFELWAQTNRLDYRLNNTYDANDPFTWNYRGLLDRQGNVLPGYWRAIYRFYYDTDAPHLRPWEMLGFVCEPIWWQTQYGAAPYTKLNTQLWADLEAGNIAQGPRAGIALRYARSGLRDLLPVDDSGTLLNPVQIGIINGTVTYETATRAWQAGDGAPAEALWRNSPSYRFALTRASFLMKPPRFVEQCWDALNVGYVHGQWVQLDRLVRPSNALQYVHGEVNPDLHINPTGVATPILGVSQWLADHLVANGQTSVGLGEAVRGLQVNLLHRMAGFVPTETVRLIADSFGLLPAEDVQTILYTSPAVDSEVYSGVIVEWTGSSWRVVGYDGRNPSFTVIPPNTAGQKGLISLAGASEPVIVNWRPGTYYPLQILINYQNSVYQCIQANTSSSIFESLYWKPRPDLSTSMIMAPRVVTYVNGLSTTQQVPYGTEFTSYQEVGDFLLGYERWLVSRGWSFTNTDPDNQILDWSLAVKEFLTWAQVQWAPGNFVALSPGQAQLQFAAAQGTILNVEDNSTGFFGLINRSGQPISQRDAIISRLDGQITLQANNADIFLARLNICNIEHALVPSNVTIFSDNVYLPLFDIRQERLLLACNRAIGWAGRLDAPGYIITNNTLKSSFEKCANDVRLMFDIELADVTLLRDYARHDVGYQERSYFNNLLLTPNNQFEFYQGMIQEKGTTGVFQKITRSTVATAPNSVLQFLEEWAFRIATFGSPRDPFLTFQLSHDDVRTDPQFVRFDTAAGSPLDWIQLTTDDPRWHDKPAAPNFFPQLGYGPAVLPTAGPVRLSEVANTAFNVSEIASVYVPNTNTLPAGSLLWIFDNTPIFQGINWFVSATGDDRNAGTSPSFPFASLQRAHDASNPGDIINVGSGTYSATFNTTVLEIARSGTSSAPIVYQAMPGTAPVILGTQSAAAVHFNAVSYVTLVGFDIAGPINVTNQDASGIIIDPAGAALSHHVTVRDCSVHDFPYNGICANSSDYTTIEGCTVFNNGFHSTLSGSGIAILNSHGIDNVTTAKIFVRRNTCYNNKNLVQNVITGTFTDGEGIVVAQNQNTQTDGIAYTGRTLIENNLCYNNGGDGILITGSSHVDVVFNTVAMNQTNLTRPLGEIATTQSADCAIFNNILVASASQPLTTNIGSTVSFGHNMINGGNSVIFPGVHSVTDPLFVNVNYGDYQLRLGSFARGAASAAYNTTHDLYGNRRPSTGLDLGCFQTNAVPMIANQAHPYDVMRSFDSAVIPNAPAFINTPNEDATLTTTRIFFQYPMSLTIDDVGNYLIIDGLTNTVPELEGLQTIADVLPELNAIDLVTVGTTGSSFASTQSSAPIIRVLRSVRFPTVAQIEPLPYNIGDLVWVDNYTPDQWAVLSYNGSGWTVAREQPQRIDASSIDETVIYSAGSQINKNQLVLNQPVIDSIDVIDPLAGLISGHSEREIDFKTQYDPASYNAGTGNLQSNVWGPNQVGRVWWDLSTVCFLDIYTDTMGVSVARDLAELQYRIGYCATVAPNASVDVYEWIASPVDPITYTATLSLPGTVYNAVSPAWVETVVFDPISRTDITMYYFWVSGLTAVPDLAFRHSSITEVASGIKSPSALGIAWMTPICQDGLVVSGVSASLDDTTTVMKVCLIGQTEAVGHNDQWVLMRPNDASSLPPDQLWTALRDSLAGFAVQNTSVLSLPDPNLTPVRNTGIDTGQAMFTVSALALTPWATGTTYYFGDQVSNGGYAYVCVVTGVSASSGNGPTGYSLTILDGSVLWAYFGVDGTRSGLLAARKAFVTSVNDVLAATPILQDRSIAATSVIGRATPFNQYQAPADFTDFTLPSYLMWSQIDASFAFELPPANEWQVEVHTLSERNDLLATAQFQTATAPISVLLSGFANPTPQWSIYVFDPMLADQIIANHPGIPATAVLLANADIVFSLKTAYDYIVSNEAARNALANDGTLNDLDRVLVTADLGGFWAIYQYHTLTGFALWRVQTYALQSFIETADWYDTATLTANGYQVSNPPVITYPNTRTRDAVEGDNPTNLLVIVTNEGSNFNWTLYLNGEWQIVAIGSATIQLSSAFYDPTHTTIFNVSTETSPKPLSNADIGNRDGSWELRVLIQALRYSGLLTDSEINQIWFDMIAFIHSQQNEVDWAFKTSFMTVAGISVPLDQTPVVTVDQTGNVIDYINEVKPYRVKVRDVTTQYTPTLDTGTFAVSESSLFNITLLFDRVSNAGGDWDVYVWDAQPWDMGDEGDLGAAWRIMNYYYPPGVDPNNPEALQEARATAVFELMALYEKEGRIITTVPYGFDDLPFDTIGLDQQINDVTQIDDGGSLTPVTYDQNFNPPLSSRPGGYDLRAPYYFAQHPEERVVVATDDALQITVTAQPEAGAPNQIIKVFDIAGISGGSTTTLFFDLIAQSNQGVLVYCDGKRATLGTDYTIDYFARTVTVNLLFEGYLVRRVLIQAFGFGGVAPIIEQHFLTYGINALVLDAPATSDTLAVVVNGTPAAYALDQLGTTVTLAQVPASPRDVALVVFAESTNAATAIQTQTMTYSGPNVWALQYPDRQTVPAHAGTIVEVNGVRLAPPRTFYGALTVAQPWLFLPVVPSNTTTYTVYVDGIVYTAAIPFCTTSSSSSNYPFQLVVPTGQTPPTNIAGQFVVFENLLVALDPSFVGDVAIVLHDNSLTPDYIVANDTLTIYASLTNGDNILVTTFSNAGSMRIQTVVYDVAATANQLLPVVPSDDYAWITMNGSRLAPEVDYLVQPVTISTNVSFVAPALVTTVPVTGTIVATMFTGQPAEHARMWMYSSKLPAKARMQFSADATSETFFNGNGSVPHGSQLFTMDKAFETTSLSPYFAGTLLYDLGPTDSTFTVSVFLKPLAASLQAVEPFAFPDQLHNKPGVIWIEGERIEYFGYSLLNGVATFTGLRRATRGTSFGSIRQVITATGDGTAHTYVFTRTGIVEVAVNNILIPLNTYTVAVTGNSTYVTVTVPTGGYIVIGLTITATHLAYTPVYNGTHRINDLPINLPPRGPIAAGYARGSSTALALKG